LVRQAASRVASRLAGEVIAIVSTASDADA
jgi:hypothetical protein